MTHSPTNQRYDTYGGVDNDALSAEAVNVALERSAETNQSQDTTTMSGRGAHVWKRVAGIVPYGGMVSNAFNLASATLGAGIVLLPSGFKDSGVIVATFLLILCCSTTIYSIRLLALTKDKTGLRSYEEMAHGLLGRGVDYFTAFLMFVFCFGTCVGYVISVGDLFSPLLSLPTTPDILRHPWGKRLLITGVWFLGMFSLSLPKKINSLRYASVVGVSAIVFFVFCMILHSAQHGLQQGNLPNLQLFSGGLGALNGLSLFIFAFICQVNCLEIYEEMKNPSPRKMTRDSTISMGLVAVFYFLAGFFGYADFGDAASNSVLRLYDIQRNVLMAIAYVGIAIKLCVGFAICIQPSRDAIYYVLGWGITADVSSRMNFLISGLLAFFALVLGLFIPSINLVFGFLGGVCGGFLAFILPALFHMYAGNWSLREVGWANYGMTYLLLILGVVAVVFGTAVAIYTEVSS